MSVTMRVLASAVPGEQGCHFLVQWRDSHAIQHGRTFTAGCKPAVSDAATRGAWVPGDAGGRGAGVAFGEVAGRGLATKQAPRRPSPADLYAPGRLPHVLPDIPRRDVQEWVNTLAASGLAPATVRHAYRAVFKSVLNDAIDDGLLASSPCYRIELPAVALPVIEPLTPAQILILADRIDSRYRAMVLLGAGCGLRWSEAAGLTRDRIHLGTRAQVTIDRQLAYRPATTRRRSNVGSPSLFAPPKTGASRRTSRCRPPWPAPCVPTCAPTRPARPAAVHHPRGERAQPGELAAADLAAPDPVSSRHPARDHLPPAPPTPRCSATPVCPTTTSSSASATPIPARSAGTVIPTPTRETARPPARPSTPPSPLRKRAASRQLPVDFVDGIVDAPRAGQQAACTFSQVTGHGRVRRQGLEPRTRG